MGDLMKKSLFVLLLVVFSLYAFSFSNQDFQVKVSEDILNRVVPSLMEGSEISDPEIRFFNNKFEFNGVGHWFIFSANFSFKGNITADDKGNLYVNIAEYWQSGSKKSKKTAIEKIHTMEEAVNNATGDNPKINIKAKYIPSDTYAGTLLLEMKDFEVLPAMPGLRIKKVNLSDGNVLIASTKDYISPNQAEVQAIVGERILNELLTMFTKPTTRSITKIEGIVVDLESDNPSLTIRYEQDNPENSCSWLKLAINMEVPEINRAELKIKDFESDGDVDNFDGDIDQIVSLINRNLSRYEAPNRGQKMNFTYDANTRTVKFNVDFNDIMPLSIKPDIYLIESGKDFVAVSGQILK